MKVGKGSTLFSALTEPEGAGGQEIIPYIKKFLTIHPYTGGYTVEDSKYVSKEQDVRKKHFHPSGDCLKCPRLLYWERDPKHAADLEEVISPELQVIFKTGNALHAMIQAWLEAMGELPGFPKFIGNEYRIDDEEWNIGGFIDSVVQFPGNGYPSILEIKTINGYRFDTLHAPLPAHKLQVGCYLMEMDSPHGIILYINKNTGALKEFSVEPVDMMPTLRKWSSVRVAVQDGDISKLDHGCRKGDKAWEKCPARTFCHR